MMRFLLRVWGISSIKTVLITGLSVTDFLYTAAFVPVKVHALVMGLVLFLLTFLFGEWIFLKGKAITRNQFIIAVVVTYVWEAFFSRFLWSVLLGDPTILSMHSLWAHVVYFLLHTAALGAALYDRRRLAS